MYISVKDDLFFLQTDKELVRDITLLTKKDVVDGILFDKKDLPNLFMELKKVGIEDANFEENAVRYMSDLLNWRNWKEEIKKNREALVDYMEGIKTVPYLDQWSGIRFFLSGQFIGNWDTMGAGKSFMVLSAFAILRQLQLAKKMLILCPNSVKLSWEDEIKKHTDFSYLIAGNGQKAVLFDIERFLTQDIFVMHYDSLLFPNIFEKIKGLKVDVIVIDEAHYIKNIKAKRTKLVLSLLQEIRRLVLVEDNNFIPIQDKERPHIWLLTGTPISERAENVFVLLKILDPELKIRYSIFDNFFNRYIRIKVYNKKKQRRMEIKKLVGYEHIEHLSNFLSPLSIRRAREELTSMPEKVFSDRILEFSSEQYEYYLKIKYKVVDELKKIKSKINWLQLENILLRLHQFVSHPQILDINCPSIKFDAVYNIISELVGNKEQVVVWFIYRRAGELLYDLLSKEFNVNLIYGGVNNDDLKQMKTNFEQKQTDIILASIKKLGTGIDFLKGAQSAIYLDMPFSFVEYMQSQNRLVRRGITNYVLLVRLIVKNSIDELILSLLDRKQEMFDKVTNDYEVDVDEIISKI